VRYVNTPQVIAYIGLAGLSAFPAGFRPIPGYPLGYECRIKFIYTLHGFTFAVADTCHHLIVRTTHVKVGVNAYRSFNASRGYLRGVDADLVRRRFTHY